MTPNGEHIEEQEQDWKETKLIEYESLEREIAATQHEMDTDANLNKLIQERNKLDEAIGTKRSKYTLDIGREREAQRDIKTELVEEWDITEKTFKCDAGAATLKTTRSLHIRSKEKLLEFLTLNKKLAEFIKSFEISKLRKIKDAGLLENDIATWDEKKSVAISIIYDTTLESAEDREDHAATMESGK